MLDTSDYPSSVVLRFLSLKVEQELKDSYKAGEGQSWIFAFSHSSSLSPTPNLTAIFLRDFFFYQVIPKLRLAFHGNSNSLFTFS